MKAISLWQPWASAIVIRSKRVETRSWETSHRGPIAIHAAKRPVDSAWDSPTFEAAFYGCRDMDLPLGAIVATADLVDCVPTVELRNDPQYQDLILSSRQVIGAPDSLLFTERDMGNYAPGRFGWILENIKRLEAPIPYRGQQRVFTIPDEVLP